MPKFRADIEVWFEAESQEQADWLSDEMGDDLALHAAVTAVANGPAVEAA